MVIREADCDGDSLYQSVKELLADTNRLKTMRKALREMAVVDSGSRICQIILDLAHEKK